MSGTPVSLTVKELEETFGVLFVGYVLAMVAYGFTFFQTYVYYSRYPLDRWAIKTTVGCLWYVPMSKASLPLRLIQAI
ncbi:hypothetical protein B0H34DRAFT_451387 [Crassisporium funariophilum]|nr:hypothetical protein B0H34DRAFT_451387 [Crassisporium funariophilum]